MNLDTDSRCNFKTYPLENSSKHTKSKTGCLSYNPQKYTCEDC